MFLFSDCMCNGHSQCTIDEKSCDKPCNHHTEGDHCDRCSKGYFGFPVNGGECERKFFRIILIALKKKIIVSSPSGLLSFLTI